jgi:hypothetical protein
MVPRGTFSEIPSTARTSRRFHLERYTLAKSEVSIA